MEAIKKQFAVARASTVASALDELPKMASLADRRDALEFVFKIITGFDKQSADTFIKLLACRRSQAVPIQPIVQALDETFREYTADKIVERACAKILSVAAIVYKTHGLIALVKDTSLETVVLGLSLTTFGNLESHAACRELALTFFEEAGHFRPETRQRMCENPSFWNMLAKVEPARSVKIVEVFHAESDRARVCAFLSKLTEDQWAAASPAPEVVAFAMTAPNLDCVARLAARAFSDGEYVVIRKRKLE